MVLHSYKGLSNDPRFIASVLTSITMVTPSLAQIHIGTMIIHIFQACTKYTCRNLQSLQDRALNQGKIAAFFSRKHVLAALGFQSYSCS